METIFGWQTFYHQNRLAKLEVSFGAKGRHSCSAKMTKLLGYSFLVEYKKGKENKVADALFRRFEGLDDLSDDLSVVEN